MAPRKSMNRKLAVRRRVYKNPYLNFMEDFREVRNDIFSQIYFNAILKYYRK